MKKINTKKVSIYFIGTILMSLGVTLGFTAKLGSAGWDSVFYSSHLLFNITEGTAMFIVSTIIIILCAIYRKSFKTFGSLLPVVLVSILIDIWIYLIFKDFVAVEMLFITRVVFTIFCALLIPLGLSLFIVTNGPKGIFDEFMFVCNELFKVNSIVKTRFVTEFLAVLLALVLSFLAGAGFGVVNIGTILITFTIGPLLNYYIKLFRKDDINEV